MRPVRSRGTRGSPSRGTTGGTAVRRRGRDAELSVAARPAGAQGRGIDPVARRRLCDNVRHDRTLGPSPSRVAAPHAPGPPGREARAGKPRPGQLPTTAGAGSNPRAPAAACRATGRFRATLAAARSTACRRDRPRRARSSASLDSILDEGPSLPGMLRRSSTATPGPRGRGRMPGRPCGIAPPPPRRGSARGRSGRMGRLRATRVPVPCPVAGRGRRAADHR